MLHVRMCCYIPQLIFILFMYNNRRSNELQNFIFYILTITSTEANMKFTPLPTDLQNHILNNFSV